jgi:hypothetical protein
MKLPIYQSKLLEIPGCHPMAGVSFFDTSILANNEVPNNMFRNVRDRLMDTLYYVRPLEQTSEHMQTNHGRYSGSSLSSGRGWREPGSRGAHKIVCGCFWPGYGRVWL